jgi:hypothetical protein
MTTAKLAGQLALLFCAAYSAALAARPANAGEPPALWPAERAGAAWALEYLAGGPASWLDDLAAGSPLRGKTAAGTEIELRAGPPAGARWRLATSADPESAIFHIVFPSGLEEVLRLRTVDENGSLKIAAIEAGWEPIRTAAPQLEAPPPAGEKPPAVPADPPPYSPALPLGIGLAALLALALAVSRPAGRPLFGAAAVVLAAVAVLLLVRPLRGPAAPAPEDGAGANKAVSALASHRLDWRRRLAAGETQLEALPAAAGEVQLWAAEEFLLSNRLELAAQALRTAGAAAESPTGRRLAARLAARRGDDSAALGGYRALLESWPHDEVYLIEAIEAAFRFGHEEESEELLARLKRKNSRWAEALRLVALAETMDDLALTAADTLEKSVLLAPTRRAELISSPLEAFLSEASPGLAARLVLGDAAEPIFPCPQEGSRAIAAPAAAAATRVGLSLFFKAGESRLELPGGCALAPPGTPAASGAAWLDAREAAQRSAASGLGQAIASRQGRPLPRERRQLGEAVAAQLQHGDWGAILELTASLDAAALGALPDEARRARVQALHRLDRRKEAFDLLLELVGSDFDQQRSDPGMLFDFAELMVKERRYELAGRLFAAADRRLPMPISADRRLQLEIEKKLLDKSLYLERGPLKVYFSPERDPVFARRIADYLENERRRLAAFIPAAKKPRQIEVLLLDWRDFRSSYGGRGVDILGLYDGRIRVPFGRVDAVDPFIGSILTHELAHALMGEASGDRAPRWLQEGLAQLVEPGRADAIPIADMKARGKWLAIPLVEAALSGMATPTLAGQGYEEALWMAIYLHETQGKQIFAKLLESCRQGHSPDEALRRHLGATPEQLDARMIAWARANPAKIWETALAD